MITSRFFFSSFRDRILLAGITIFLAVIIYVHIFSGMIGDKFWILTAARMWLLGKKLYIDIFEINPPLIVWIYALPVWISFHETYLQDYHHLILIVLGIIALSIFLCTKILQSDALFSGNRERQIQCALLLIASLIVWINPAFFADREHLFLTLTLPYVFRFLPSVEVTKLGLSVRYVIAIMAAIGFCIKPHCAVVWLAVQALVIVRTRSWAGLFCLENIIIYGFGIIYLGTISVTCPEYYKIILPMAYATYATYSNNWVLSVVQFLTLPLFIVGITFIDFRWKPSSPYRKDIVYLIGIAAAELIYACLNNGWGYTFYPLTITLLLLSGWVMWEFLYLCQVARENGLPDKRFTFGLRNCLFNFFINILFIVAVEFHAFHSQCADLIACNMQRKINDAAQEAHIHSFGTIAMSFKHWPYLMRATGATMQTRFHHIWMMPKIFTASSDFTQKNAWIADYVAQAYADDLNSNQPQMMLVDTSPELLYAGKHVDLIKYFSTWPSFRAAWSHYVYSKTLNYCDDSNNHDNTEPKKHPVECRYDIYLRQ